MKQLDQVKRDIFLLLSICAVFANCQENVVQNGTKIVGLKDPEIDATVKSALENGTVSEVVVRKDLLLFPINAPNLVIAHRQEIHAVPQNNGTESTDGRPTAAEVAEVNEYSLSQVISNDTNDNEAESPNNSTPESSAIRGPENDAVLEPGKLLEVPSGFNFSNGLATEKVTLPEEVQNISVPKQSIVDVLSKSLAQSDATLTTVSSRIYKLFKRSVDSDDDDDDDDDDADDDDDGDDDDDEDSDKKTTTATSTTTTTTDATLVDYSAMVKRSVDSQDEDDENDDDDSNSDDDDDDDDDSSSSSTTTENVDDSTDEVEKRSIDSEEDDSSSSTTQNPSTTEIVKRSVDSTTTTTESSNMETSSSNIVKRSIDLDDDDDDDSASTTEFYDHEE